MSDSQHDKGSQPFKLVAGLLMGGSAGIAFCFKVVTDNLIRAGDSVNWTLVYIVYAVCAVLFIGGLIDLTKKQA